MVGSSFRCIDQHGCLLKIKACFFYGTATAYVLEKQMDSVLFTVFYLYDRFFVWYQCICQSIERIFVGLILDRQ